MPGRKLSPEERRKRARTWSLKLIREATTGSEKISKAADYARRTAGKGPLLDAELIADLLVLAAETPSSKLQEVLAQLKGVRS